MEGLPTEGRLGWTGAFTLLLRCSASLVFGSTLGAHGILTFVPRGLLSAKLNCYGMLQSVCGRQIGNTLKQNRKAWGLLTLLGWLLYISLRGKLDAVLGASIQAWALLLMVFVVMIPNSRAMS